MEVDGKNQGREEVKLISDQSNGRSPMFILNKFKKVVKSEGGEVKVVSGYKWKGDINPMHIGFITMKPNTLFIPQYLDANLILFVQTGEVKVGWIHKDAYLVEERMKMGDVNVIPAGSAFYFVNVGNDDEKLSIICSIDASGTSEWNSYQSFFIGGGRNPTSVIAGFGVITLRAAFNVTMNELSFLMKKKSGPIIYMTNTTKEQHLLPSMIKLKLKLQQKQSDNGKEIHEDDDDDDYQYKESYKTWSWRKLVSSLISKKKRKGGRVHSPESLNLYNTEPGFCNDYGTSVSIDKHQYSPLKISGIGVYYVNLTAGSMMAPHFNPTATEYGVVLKGSGIIQVVFPNGTNAMTARVRAGDVFWVPRYFPFCQIASMDGSFEFFGFTTSARENRPQFLVGESSVLKSMMGPELAAAFGVAEEWLERVVEAQSQSVILPPLHVEGKN
ncbi:vicilin-like seed storage protein At2g28490 [Dioscorea cayenensis subsp. rotundata]|uniref:Vicilin-like seed storage protein At2g28490 n=1 Tax=Dioscorea cayennensis subsp. rotundata TaxID=55577 RepID=A0AB40AK78_DIOCR|nr:vicilin-like seed storage protein At2g28490 [Dioscorea cayenensis subsp. rotundata]